MELLKLVESGDVERVHQAIRYADVDYQNENGRTALHCAVECGHIQIIGILLKAGADHKVKDKNGMTPFLFAADQCRGQALKVLLSAGSDMSTRTTKEGWTALHLACIRKDDYLVQILTIKGADPLIRDHVGRTALHYAAEWGNATAVAKLLQIGADPTATDQNGQVALDPTSELAKAAAKQVYKGGDPQGIVEVYCPERPDLGGIYERLQEDQYQRVGSKHTMVRLPDSEIWHISDGDHFVACALTSTLDPTGVRDWQLHVSGCLVPCRELYVRRLAVQSAGCDECSMHPILGPAYYCVSRHDYQMCSECERRAIQPFPTMKVYAAPQSPAHVKYTSHLHPEIGEVPTYEFDPDVVHTGTTCSACNVSPIRGPRFLCVTRQGYQLCGACESQVSAQDTPPYAMIKVYDPRHHPARIEYALKRASKLTALEYPPLSAEDTVVAEGESATDPAWADGGELDPVFTGTGGGTTQAGNLRVHCVTLPQLSGLYSLTSEGHYASIDGANKLVRHSTEGTWCISNGQVFQAMAVDAADSPSTVQVWKCLIPGSGYQRCSDLTVTNEV